MSRRRTATAKLSRWLEDIVAVSPPQAGSIEIAGACTVAELQPGMPGPDDAVDPLQVLVDAIPLAIPLAKVARRKSKSVHAHIQDHVKSRISCTSPKHDLAEAEQVTSLKFDGFESPLGNLVTEVECMKSNERVEQNELEARLGRLESELGKLEGKVAEVECTKGHERAEVNELLAERKEHVARFGRLESQLGTLEGKVVDLECTKSQERIESNETRGRETELPAERTERLPDPDESEAEREEFEMDRSKLRANERKLQADRKKIIVDQDEVATKREELNKIIAEQNALKEKLAAQLKKLKQKEDPQLLPQCTGESSLKSVLNYTLRKLKKRKMDQEREQKLTLAKIFAEVQSRNWKLESSVSRLEVEAATAQLPPAYAQFVAEIELKLKFLKEEKNRLDIARELESALNRPGMEAAKEGRLPPVFAHFVDELELKLKFLKEEENRLKIAREPVDRNSNKETEGRLCQICLESDTDAIIFPCMHFQYCSVCLEAHRTRIDTCPTCRTAISDITTVLTE